MKRVIFYLTLLAIVWSTVPVVYASDIRISLKESVLKVTGICTGDVVTIDLKNQDKIIYNSQITCFNNEYSFQDDLSVWGISEGVYQIVINGQSLQQSLTYKKEKAPEHKLVSLGSEKKNLAKEEKSKTLSLDGALTQFGESLQRLDEALVVIEDEAQKNESYANSLKGSLVSVMRDALGVLTGFFSDFENASIEENSTEEVPVIISEQHESEQKDQVQTAPIENSPEQLNQDSETKKSQVDSENILNSDGLQVESQEVKLIE